MNRLRFWGIAAVWVARCALLAGVAAACATDDAPLAAPTAASAPTTPYATVAPLPTAPSVVAALTVGVAVSATPAPSSVVATPTASAAASAAPTATVAVVSAPSLAATALPTTLAYDSNSAMYKVFPGFGRTGSGTYEALEGVRRNGDVSLVAALVESMRFQATANAREATADVLRALTGEAYGGEDWKGWMEWLGKRRAEYPPPSGYLDWKINLLSEISPRFRRFLGPAREGAIAVDPTELVWGGVLPDGIPDIRNPIMLAADEADFLAADERVFGVAINGDARAYPLRIANAHEMVNDVVGGEPIALSW